MFKNLFKNTKFDTNKIDLTIKDVCKSCSRTYSNPLAVKDTIYCPYCGAEESNGI